jgi:hypothetical protein
MNVAGRLRRKDRIAGRNIAGDSFLIPICGQPADMENIFILNPLADFIWQRLDGEHTQDGILGDIVENFDVDKRQAGADLAEFIALLQKNDLIEEVA